MGKVLRIADLTERTCRACEETKPRAEFVIDKGFPTTLCRLCHRALCRQRYAENREHRKAQERARRAAAKAVDPEGWKKQERERKHTRRDADPVGYILTRTRMVAKQASLPFDLERDDIFIPEFCPVLGLRLTPLGEGRGEAAPEIDRLVPALGYARGNIAIISHRANRLKQDGTAAEHERVAAWMRSRGAT
jgi:hypothetical protein